MIFFPPSFVFFHCARWFLTHFCSTAASGQQNVHPAHDRWWPHLTSYKDHLVFLGRFSKHSSRFSPGPQTWVTNSCRKKIKPASQQCSMSWCCHHCRRSGQKTCPRPGTGTAACFRLCMLVPRICVTTRGALVLKDCSSSLLCQAARRPLSKLDSQRAKAWWKHQILPRSSISTGVLECQSDT